MQKGILFVRMLRATSHIIAIPIHTVTTDIPCGPLDGETDRRRYSMTSKFECTGPDGKGCPHGVESDKLTPRDTDLKLCDDCYREYRKKEVKQ